MTRREKIILEGEDRVSAPVARAESGFRRFDDNLKKMATIGGLFFAGQALLKLGTASVRAAVDAEEAGAAFETTFGVAAQRAGEYVEGMANKAGMAGYQLQQLMAITGNVVQGIGATETASEALSERMVNLAADVASFSNAEGGAQAVLLALQSAINGEREALKTYGLAVSEAEVQAKAFEMTGKTSADQLTRLDKALATVEVAYGKAGKAVGDLDRTADSHANTLRRVQAQWEEAKVTLGQALLPVLDRLLPIFERIAQPLANLLVPAFEALGVALTILNPILQAIAAILEGVPGWALLAGGAIITLAVHFKTFSNVLYALQFQALRAQTAVAAISPVMAAVTGIAIVGGLALGQWRQHAQEAEAQADTLKGTLDETTGAFTELTKATLADMLVAKAVDDDLAAVGLTIDDLWEKLQAGDPAIEDYEQVLWRLATAGGGLSDTAIAWRRIAEFVDQEWHPAAQRAAADWAAEADALERRNALLGEATDATEEQITAEDGLLELRMRRQLEGDRPPPAGDPGRAAAALRQSQLRYQHYLREQEAMETLREAAEEAAQRTAEAWAEATGRVASSFGALPGLITKHEGNIQLAVDEVLAGIRQRVDFQQDLAALAAQGLDSVAAALEEAGPEAGAAADYYLANITEAFDLEGELDAAALAGLAATDPDAHPLAQQQAIAGYYRLGAAERQAYERGWNSYGEPIHPAGHATGDRWDERVSHGGWRQVPDRGGGRDVPALLQPGETVLSRQESDAFRSGRSSSTTTVEARVTVPITVAWPVSRAEARKITRTIQAELDALTAGEVHEWQRSR